MYIFNTAEDVFYNMLCSSPVVWCAMLCSIVPCCLVLWCGVECSALSSWAVPSGGLPHGVALTCPPLYPFHVHCPATVPASQPLSPCGVSVPILVPLAVAVLVIVTVPEPPSLSLYLPLYSPPALPLPL